jgi:hypothetical protein
MFWCIEKPTQFWALSMVWPDTHLAFRAERRGHRILKQFFNKMIRIVFKI